MYLQNFFQVGDRVLDVAFEEMEAEQDTPVHITPLQEGRYTNFHSLTSYKDAVEGYYHMYSFQSMAGILGKYAFFYPFLLMQKESGYCMNMPIQHTFLP